MKKFHGQTVLHGIDLEVKLRRSGGNYRSEWFRQNHVATCSTNLLEQPEKGTITVSDITIDTARSIKSAKSLIRQLRNTSGLSSRTLICFRIIGCWRTLLKTGDRQGEPKEEATARARGYWRKLGWPVNQLSTSFVWRSTAACCDCACAGNVS